MSIAGQVQSAVGLSSARLVAVEQIRALEDMVAQDLARMIPAPDGAPNPPFAPASGFTSTPPLSLERNLAGAAPGDPAIPKWPVDPGRCADVIQIFATVSDTSKNPTVAARGVARYAMDTTGTGGTPALRSPVGGGPQVGRIRRSLRIADAGEMTARQVPASPQLPPVIVDNVLSFQVDYLDGRAMEIVNAGGRSGDVFYDPDAQTKDGTKFIIDGNVALDCTVAAGPRATATDPTFGNLIQYLPIGSPVLLRLKPDSYGPSLPQTFLVRGRSVNGNNCILLNDRPIQEDGNPGDPLHLKAFLPPAAIRITVVVLFGKGPENSTARFVRVIPVPR